MLHAQHVFNYYNGHSRVCMLRDGGIGGGGGGGGSEGI